MSHHWIPLKKTELKAIKIQSDLQKDLLDLTSQILKITK